ncbi:enoyl-CoA hydratase/isomerase family protein [Thalassospira sp. TSL5-1]|uniref:enoyl-CoA hydratase/isomerase family protein n=1 Tax=Thalassospira sp. TSL5-1 TaxID=1544451 RepID=UPI00093A6390|nr:enoyl-CoA hydratase-related protein [Thalassospira sp. TSL5-1]OKH87512.1 enoyl-CoA hydratase [Thalassospira sp. TSL5-1]
MSSQDAVLLKIENDIATLTLNRPERMNALDDAMVTGLLAALDQIENEIKNIGAVIITGSGGTFMAGGDVKFFHQLGAIPANEAQPQIRAMIDRVHEIITRLVNLPCPVIASASGAVAGFGLSLLNACDMALATDETVFTLAYCHIGTSPDGGATHSLVRLVGMKKAKEIALLGDRFDANEALRLGLINQVVEGSELEKATAKLAMRLAAGPRAALAKTKALLNSAPERDLHSQLAAEAEAFAECAISPDFREGVRAFVEKRKPVFNSK